MAIIVGEEAIDRASFNGFGNTYLSAGIPSTGTGFIVKVELYVVGATMTNLELGTFFSLGGDDFECRAGSGQLANLAIGYNLITGLNLSIVAGDLIGCFWSPNGQLEFDSTGGDGVWNIIANKCTAGNTGTFSKGGCPVCSMSLHGIGGIPTFVNSGYVWVEGFELHFGDENNFERHFLGAKSGATGQTPGFTWIEGGTFLYIDGAGDERYFPGAKSGATGQTPGFTWIEESNIHFIDSDGNERYASIGTLPGQSIFNMTGFN